MNFQRSYFIKDLFDAKKVLDGFTVVNFKSISALKNYIKSGIYTDTVQEFSVVVTDKLDLISLESCNIPNKIIVIKYDDNMQNNVLTMIKPFKNIELSSSHDSVSRLVGCHSPLIDSVLHWTEYYLNADNYETEIEKLIKLCLADPRFKWIDLQIDYESFETKPISELHKLYFYMNQLRLWTHSESLIPGERIILKGKTSPLKCWVDENLNIGLTNNDIYFPLGDHLGKNGETMNMEDLNKIRKVLDVEFPDSKIKNKYLIDLDQNKRIMGDHYRIPHITTIIGEWLEL